MGLRAWLREHRLDARARRLIAGLFRDPALLAGTSLRPRHAARWVLIDREDEESKIVRVRFGIVRHPRPYAFSPQSHKVLERYVYDVRTRQLTREGGRNITRERGLDAD